MKLTPMDVRKAEFRRTLRGYDPEEVRILLDMVADEYEKLLQENGMLSEKIRHLSERLDEYHNLEKTLQSSIVTAERIAAESQERSRREAESLIEDGRIRGERILEDARERLRMLSREVQDLRSQKDLFIKRFHTLLTSQMDTLSSQQNELEKIDALDARANNLISGEGMARAESRAMAESRAIEGLTLDLQTRVAQEVEAALGSSESFGEAALSAKASITGEDALVGETEPREIEQPTAPPESGTRPRSPLAMFAGRQKPARPPASGFFRRQIERSEPDDNLAEEGAIKWPNP